MSDSLSDSLAKTRTKRKNAGSRLRSLIQAEEIINFTEEDEDVDLLFQEDGTDEEFDIDEEEAEQQKAKVFKTSGEASGDDQDLIEEVQQEDVSSLDELKALQDEGAGFVSDAAFDSDQMFSDSGEENEDEHEDEDEESQLQKQERMQRRKEAKKKRAIPKIRPPSLNSMDAQNNNETNNKLSRQKRKVSSLTPSETTMENLLSGNRRASKRRATIQNKVELVNKLKESEKRRQAIKPKQKKETHVMTQEERLLEAIETEKANIESLTRFKEQEIIKKEKRSQILNRKKDLLTDVIRFISKVHYVTPEEEMKERAILEEIERRRARRTRKRGPRKRTTATSNIPENMDSSTSGKINTGNPDKIIIDNSDNSNAEKIDALKEKKAAPSDGRTVLKELESTNIEVTSTSPLSAENNSSSLDKTNNMNDAQTPLKSASDSQNLEGSTATENLNKLDSLNEKQDRSLRETKETSEMEKMSDENTVKSLEIEQDPQSRDGHNKLDSSPSKDSSNNGFSNNCDKSKDGSIVKNVNANIGEEVEKPEVEKETATPVNKDLDSKPIKEFEIPSNVDFSNENKQEDIKNESEVMPLKEYGSIPEENSSLEVKKEMRRTFENKSESDITEKATDFSVTDFKKSGVVNTASENSFKEQEAEDTSHQISKLTSEEHPIEIRDSLQNTTGPVGEKADDINVKELDIRVSTTVENETKDKPLDAGNLLEDVHDKDFVKKSTLSSEPYEQSADTLADNDTQMQQTTKENEIPKVFFGPNYKVCRNYITLENFQNQKTLSNLTNLKTFLFGDQSNWSAQRKTNNTERIAVIKSESGVSSSLGFSDDEEDSSTLKLEKAHARSDIFIPFCDSKKSEFENLFKLPKFGDTSNQIVINAEDTTLVKEDEKEIVIKTEAPSSVYLATGESNNNNNTSNDDALRKKCFITGKPALYFEPRTGIPYSSADAYKVIDMIRKGEFTWIQEEKIIPNDQSSTDSKESISSKKNSKIFLGSYVTPLSGGARAARGVPPGFLD